MPMEHSEIPFIKGAMKITSNSFQMMLNCPSAKNYSCKVTSMVCPQLQTFIRRGKALEDLALPHRGFTLASIKASRAEASRCEYRGPLEL